MFKTPWNEKTIRQKAASIGLIIGIFFGCAVIAYAVSSYIPHGSFVIQNTRGSMFTIDLTGPLHALMPFVKDLAMDIIKQQGGLGGAASFAGSFLNVGLDVDRCLVSVELYDFDGVGDIDIPDAARNAPVSTGVSVR